MQGTDKCVDCGTALCQLDKALHRKLISRGATAFKCKKCLAVRLGFTEEELCELARRWQGEGCTLFDGILIK